MRVHSSLLVALAAVTVAACDESSPIGPEPIELDITPTLVATVPVAENYGIHDTYVRDGLAFVAAWNSGLLIYDVGDGRKGGSPSNPRLVSSIVTSANGIPGGPAVHNSWWFHNPVTQQKRYVFVGQEGPSTFGEGASGDIHIVDVSNLEAPTEVGFIRVPGAGAHNFWMDEARQVLYAAYYNGGVIAVDVSGTLSGDMSSRIIARSLLALPETYVWGVMLSGNMLYATDMKTGFWALDPITLEVRGTFNNMSERYTSDLWITGSWAYAGTWGIRLGARGNAIKVFSLPGGSPVLADSIIITNVGTVSDVAVTPDGTQLVATTEHGIAAGLYIFDRTNPQKPTLTSRVTVAQGLHTGEVAVIGGRTYVFAARNPPNPALMIYDITDARP